VKCASALVPVFLCFALLATGCSGAADGADPATAQTAVAESDDGNGEAAVYDVKVVRIAPRPFREYLEVTGTLLPWEDVDVSSELGGLVREIAFLKGKPVDKGQVIARVGDDIARAQLEQARAELVDAEEKYERAKQLFERGAIPEQEVTAATSSRNAQRALVEERELRLARSVIRSPIDGVAVDEPVDEGEVIAPGTRVTTVQQIERLKLQADVPDTEIGWLDVGREGVVEVDAFPDRSFEAEIYYVSPAADRSTRTFTVELELANREGLLRPGMITRVTLLRRSVSDGIVIPLDAVLVREEGQHVFVVEEGRTVERTVEIAAVEGEEALVEAGLEPGDQLVVEGQRQVGPDQPVRVQEAP
jgi:membrane fusion protein (multidrug efflux system)